jgi:CheY-like chemotaxis protein
MNVCAKINSIAPPNGMVVGSDLYYISKKFSSFSSSFFGNCQCYFKKIGEYSIAATFKHQYPVYSVVGREEDVVNILDLEKQIPKLQKPSSSLREAREIEERQQTQLQKNASPTTATIMLVDDDPDILLTYKTFLTDGGYNVDAFTDPREALTRFAAQADPNNYNLVVMDIRMPNLNGLQLYYRLKAINPNIKILFVSALDAAQEMVSILPGIELDDVVRKPVDQKQFLYKVKTAAELE